MTTRSLINEFLALKRFALIGVSRNGSDFSRKLFRDLRQAGYEIVPVNPSIPRVDGVHCFTRAQEITPPVTAALLMVSERNLGKVLADCGEAGITILWIYGIMGARGVSPEAIRTAQDLGMEVIAGHCPYMFIPDASLFHRFHGFAWKVIGLYPQ